MKNPHLSEKPKFRVGQHVVISAPNASGKGVVSRVFERDHHYFSIDAKYPDNLKKYSYNIEVFKPKPSSAKKVIEIGQDYLSIDVAYMINRIVQIINENKTT